MSIFVPLEGTYLVVCIDPVATVKYFEDPEVTALAQKLSTNKYISYVCSIDENPRPTRPYHRCTLEFVGPGVPAGSALGTLCVPIAPVLTPPVFREPLFPQPPFPFADCYQHSFRSAAVRIPTQSVPARRAWKLPTREIFKHIGYLVEDDAGKDAGAGAGAAREGGDGKEGEVAEGGTDAVQADSAAPRSRAASASAHSGTGTRSSDVASADYAIRVPWQSNGDSNHTDEAGAGGDEGSAVGANGDKPPFMHDLDDDAVFVPVVSMSVDLTEVDRVADPRGFVEEQAALEKLIALAQARRLDTWTGDRALLDGTLAASNANVAKTRRTRFAKVKRQFRRLSAALAETLPLRKPREE